MRSSGVDKIMYNNLPAIYVMLPTQMNKQNLFLKMIYLLLIEALLKFVQIFN